MFDVGEISMRQPRDSHSLGMHARVLTAEKPGGPDLKHLICLRTNIITLLTRRRERRLSLPLTSHIRLNLVPPNRRA
jgi:hypothetical protein